jgi:DNA-binding transcriptional MerR regulator
MDDAKRGYYAGEAAEVTGIPYRTLDHWARTGLVTPSISEARGAGRSRLYSLDDLVALRVARELREKGISIQSLRKVIKKLRAIGLENPLAGAHLLVIGKDVAIVKSPSEIESILSTPGQQYLTPGLIFDLRKPMAEVRSNIVKLRVA